MQSFNFNKTKNSLIILRDSIV